MIGIIDQCVLNERWVGIAGKESRLNGIPIKTDGVPTLSDAEMYSTTPDMFQPGDALTKFNTMKGAVRTPHYGTHLLRLGSVQILLSRLIWVCMIIVHWYQF